jgi:DNA-binding CsgD family transcriptional regulator
VRRSLAGIARNDSRRFLVGREPELALLRRAVDDAWNGNGRVVLITGEAGIGKTGLAASLTTSAAARGAIVVWGRCNDADGTPPYWPWAECIRGAVRSQRLEHLALPPSVSERLAGLIPEMGAGLPSTQGAAAAAPASERFHLFDAVRTFFQRTASLTPMVLILEDVHQADPSSLLLLEFLGRELKESRLLMLITSRDDELSPRLIQTLGELARTGLHTLALRGLTVDETRRVIAKSSGRPCSRDVAALVHSRTGGNPFFVTELARMQPLNLAAVPENVRSALWQRLSKCSAFAHQLLLIAAVLGQEFDFRYVGTLLGDIGDADLLDALDEALDRLIIESVPTRGEHWYRFRHALIRDALYESVSPSRVAHWHAAVVELLEAQPGGSEDRVEELAYHAARSESLVGASRVSRYSRLAGERTLASHAFDEALAHFERARRTRNGARLDDEGAAILMGLGYAQAATTVRWNRQEAWRLLRRALDHYLSVGEVASAVAAATHPSLPAEGLSGVAEVIERLLPLVPEGSRAAGTLLARQAAAVYFESGDEARAGQALGKARAIAAIQQDAALELRILAHATSVGHFSLRWLDVLTESRRVLTLAERADDLYCETYARYRAAFVLTHFGRSDEAAVEAQGNLAAAERLGDRGLLSDSLFVNTLLAQMKGQWADARAHSDRGLALAPGHLPLLHARAVLEFETGNDRVGSVYLQRLMVADRDAHSYPIAGAFTALALSQAACITGDRTGVEQAAAAARMILARPAAIQNAVVSARIARGLLAVLEARGDDCASELEALEPFAQVMPTQWCLSTGRVLGLLAHRAGHRRRAIRHFQASLTFCRASGFTPELAWTCHDYAATLLQSGSAHDRIQAAALLNEAEQAAAALGLAGLRRRITEFRRRCAGRLVRKPGGLTARELEVLQLLVAGRTNKEIAQALFISVHTVNVHVARVLHKTGTSNRTEAAAFAARQQLVEPAR